MADALLKYRDDMTAAEGKDRNYTIADIEALPDGRRAELIDGHWYDMAAPSRIHQELVGQLVTVMNIYNKRKGGGCKIYPAPFAVYLNRDDRNYVEPDISVICDKDKLTDKPVFGGDAAGDDVLLETMEGGVIIDGESFSPVQDSSGGVRWIPDSYLRPLVKVPELSFRLRSLGGSESVCAMSGLLLVAVISPQLTEFEERVMQDIRRAIGASDMEKW